MEKIDPEKIIYSLCIEDLQNVAIEELDRKLTPKELLILEDKIGDYIDWYSVIHCAIIDNINK
jgi:hypothetical protein